MTDRPFTPEELAILRRAQEIVLRSLAGVYRPEKLDVIELRCHPDDEAEMRLRFDAPFVIDPTVERGKLLVMPHLYAKHIKATFGFANPAPLPAVQDGTRRAYCPDCSAELTWPLGQSEPWPCGHCVDDGDI